MDNITYLIGAIGLCISVISIIVSMVALAISAKAFVTAKISCIKNTKDDLYE